MRGNGAREHRDPLNFDGTPLSSTVLRAFTLIELLVAVTLMSFIVLGLLAMLTTTQRAFRGSLNTADVEESGRIATEMIVRELEQMTPSQTTGTTNFSVELDPFFSNPLGQGLPGTQVGLGQKVRTNIVEQFFFLSQNNLTWSGIGYQVWPDFPNPAGSGYVGTLYRFATSSNKYSVSLMSSNFEHVAVSNLSRIADGVVHLRLRVFSTNGLPITNSFGQGALSGPGSFFVPSPTPGTAPVRNCYWNVPPNPGVPYEGDCYFVSNAVPAYLELELGILEPAVVDRYRSLYPNTGAQLKYLSNHVAQVHIFRQRVAVPNVDFAAYR